MQKKVNRSQEINTYNVSSRYKGIKVRIKTTLGAFPSGEKKKRIKNPARHTIYVTHSIAASSAACDHTQGRKNGQK